MLRPLRIHRTEAAVLARTIPGFAARMEGAKADGDYVLVAPVQHAQVDGPRRLGDGIAAVLHLCRLDAAAALLFPRSTCGCGRRQALLNRIALPEPTPLNLCIWVVWLALLYLLIRRP